MNLNPREKKKAQAQICKKLKNMELISPSLKKEYQSNEPLKYYLNTSDDYVAIGVYKQSLIQMDKKNPADDLFSSYCVWFNVYMSLLHQHKHKYKDTFEIWRACNFCTESGIRKLSK